MKTTRTMCNRLSPSSFHVTLLLTLALFHLTSSQNTYSKFTDQVFKAEKTESNPSGQPTGLPAALWDTNQDRLTDVIVWSKKSNEYHIEVYESKTNLQAKHPVLEKSITTVKVTDPIKSVVPGDFDGDMSLDLMIVTDSFKLYISWGSKSHEGIWQLATPQPFPASNGELLRQPIVWDYDGNTVPDLLVQVKEDDDSFSFQRLFVSNPGTKIGQGRQWEMDPLKELTDFAKKDSLSLTDHSSAFVDIDHDLIADLCLTMKDKKNKYFLVVVLHKAFEPNKMQLESFNFKDIKKIPLNFAGDIEDIGQITYVDFNNDLRTDALIPFRMSNGTTSIWLYDWASDEKTDITPAWGGYQPLGANVDKGIPLRIHMGDFDQDGYIDGVIVAQKGKDERKVMLLQNVKTSTDPDAADNVRKFELKINEYTNDIKVDGTFEMASFFDAYDNGFLDILVVSSKDSKFKIDAFQNNLGIDATWIKAMVYTAYCDPVTGSSGGFPECSSESDNIALSLPVVGASFHMTTTRGDGKQQNVAAGLLTQLTHFALQMPTTIFGLGRSPNFVDQIAVGLAPALNYSSGDTHSKRFEQTIPNSAVVINPRPLTKPSQWRAYIYVTPSSAMLETGIVLSVVFALLAILVGLLHLKEKREDQKEKLVEMQRFHFDAM